MGPQREPEIEKLSLWVKSEVKSDQNYIAKGPKLKWSQETERNSKEE